MKALQSAKMTKTAAARFLWLPVVLVVVVPSHVINHANTALAYNTFIRKTTTTTTTDRQSRFAIRRLEFSTNAEEHPEQSRMLDNQQQQHAAVSCNGDTSLLSDELAAVVATPSIAPLAPPVQYQTSWEPAMAERIMCLAQQEKSSAPTKTRPLLVGLVG
jgi:hypothetical protein